MKQVAMKLRADIADSITVDAPAPDAPEEAMPTTDVAATLRDFGADVHAMHPSTTDPDLASWFVVDVPEDRSATHLATSLLDIDGVEAAYEQPPVELP